MPYTTAIIAKAKPVLKEQMMSANCPKCGKPGSEIFDVVESKSPPDYIRFKSPLFQCSTCVYPQPIDDGKNWPLEFVINPAGQPTIVVDGKSEYA